MIDLKKNLINMIDVVIDSNIYRSEGLNKSQNLALLKDMGNNNFVKIHIPWCL